MIEKANGKIADSSVTGDEKIPFEYEAPEKQSYILNGENITVKIDAQVYIPEYSLSMAILEDRNIKYSQIESFFELLGLDNKNLYNLEFVEIATTQQHFEGMIDRQLQEIALMKEEGEDTSYLEEHMELMCQKKETAPKDYIEAANRLGLSDDSMSKTVEITEDNYNSRAYTLIVGEENWFSPMIQINAVEGETQRLIYDRNAKAGVPSARCLSEMDEKGFSMEEGRSIAEPYISVFSEDLELVEIGTMGAFEDVYDPRPYGYVFVYKRVINGVRNEYVLSPNDGWRGAAVASANISMEDELVYSAPNAEEKLVISVTNEGLYVLDYSAPRVVSEILAYPIQILPFEKLMERFDQYIVMHGYDDKKTINIEINRIQLGMMDLKVADESHKYLSIPVWDFYGDCEIIAPGIEELRSDDGSDPFHSWLTINAIDGSIIDRRRGY